MQVPLLTMHSLLELHKRNSAKPNLDFDSPQLFSLTMNNKFASVNVHWLSHRAKGRSICYNMATLSDHLLTKSSGLQKVHQIVKNILHYAVSERLPRICEVLHMYGQNLFGEQGKDVHRRDSASQSQAEEQQILPRQLSETHPPADRPAKRRRLGHPAQGDVAYGSVECASRTVKEQTGNNNTSYFYIGVLEFGARVFHVFFPAWSGQRSWRLRNLEPPFPPSPSRWAIYSEIAKRKVKKFGPEFDTSTDASFWLQSATCYGQKSSLSRCRIFGAGSDREKIAIDWFCPQEFVPILFNIFDVVPALWHREYLLLSISLIHQSSKQFLEHMVHQIKFLHPSWMAFQG